MIEEPQVITDINDWTNNTTNISQAQSDPNLAAIKYISESIVGYMPSPICYVGGLIASATTMKIYDIVEFKSYLMNNDIKIYLYQLVWVPSMPLFSQINTKTFIEEILDEPIIRDGYFLIRYCNHSDLTYSAIAASFE